MLPWRVNRDLARVSTASQPSQQSVSPAWLLRRLAAHPLDRDSLGPASYPALSQLVHSLRHIRCRGLSFHCRPSSIAP